MIPAIIAGAGALIGGALGMAGQLSSNATNQGLNKENRDWQERMANTAHQREVADLRAAGLNPILSATGGKGAITPTTQPAQVENVMRDAPGAFSAASSNAIAQQQLQLQKALNAAQILDIGANINLKETQAYESRTRGNVNEVDAISKSMLNANPDFVAATIRNLHQSEATGKAQETASYASARASDWTAQGKSLPDLAAKILGATFKDATGKSAPSLGELFRALILGNRPAIPAGQSTGFSDRPEAGGRHSAKP